MRILLAMVLAALVAGCSVGMAAYGHREPDLRNIQVGSDRSEVDSYLGKPDEEFTKGGRQVAIYEYEVGNAPAPARAGMHAILDIGTLGFWEFVGTPIEFFKGEKRRLRVIYGPDNKVVQILKES
jgi:hypothetical protein